MGIHSCVCCVHVDRFVWNSGAEKQCEDAGLPGLWAVTPSSLTQQAPVSHQLAVASHGSTQQLGASCALKVFVSIHLRPNLEMNAQRPRDFKLLMQCHTAVGETQLRKGLLSSDSPELMWKVEGGGICRYIQHQGRRDRQAVRVLSPASSLQFMSSRFTVS